MRKLLLILLISALPFWCFSQIEDSTFFLNEVEVTSNYNPALRIVQTAIENRELNSIYSRNNFKCNIFHKVLFTTQLLQDSSFITRFDSISSKINNNTPLSKKDSNYLKAHKFASNNHFFIMETVSEKIFKKPNIETDKIIAQHTAGMKDPFLAMYATQIQSFSIYRYDFIEVLEKKYVSPVSVAALNKYRYKLLSKEIVNNDTLFTISFAPQKNAHFISLEGTMIINSLNFAIQEIKFAPFDKELDTPFEIEHHYKQEKNGCWFPEEISYSICFKELSLFVNEGTMYIISTQKISNIEVDIPLKSYQLDFTDISVEENNKKKQESILNSFRNRSLDSLEINTYKLWDTIGEKTKFDKRIFFIKTLATGKLALGPINIDLDNLIHFNEYEKARFGLSLNTNNKMSKYFSFGGFFGYGIQDKQWKWGGNINVKFIRSRDFILSLSYRSDVIECAGTHFFDRDYTVFSGEFYRSWLIANFDQKKLINATLQGKATRWLTCYISTEYSQNQTCFPYNYQEVVDESSPNYKFNNYQLKMGLRLGFKEHSMDDQSFIFYRISPYPIITLQYTHGFANVFKSNFNYNRLDFKFYHLQNYRILGFTEFFLCAGAIDRDLPYSLLYTPHAGLANGFPIGFDGKEQFAVMSPHEFICDQYLSLFVRHNFGRMTQNRNFSPRIVLAQHFGIGALQHPENHYGVTLKTMEKGYFETGIIVEDLLVIYKLLSFGIGTYYRYGAYHNEKELDNWAFKVKFRVSMAR